MAGCCTKAPECLQRKKEWAHRRCARGRKLGNWEAQKRCVLTMFASLLLPRVTPLAYSRALV